MSQTEHRLALPTGTMVATYLIERVLGEGGFGITYLAEHTGLRRRIALKELLPFELATRAENSQVVARTSAQEDDFNWARERFLDEGRVLARFRHPNIVSVHDIFQANGTAYMATGYEEGCDLDRWCRSRSLPIPESEILAVLSGVLDGLETVHGTGLLHRDLKPQNIYLTADGHPILLDFGSARQAISQKSRAITSIVTPGYAPFEQYHEDGNQGPWTDIYAMGGVLHFMLTGQRPPDASKRVLTEVYEPVAIRLRGTYSPALLEAVDWALRPLEHERPRSVPEWRAVLPPVPGAVLVSSPNPSADAAPAVSGPNPRTQRALLQYPPVKGPGAGDASLSAVGQALPPPLPESVLLPEIESREFGIATVSLAVAAMILVGRSSPLWALGLTGLVLALGFVFMHRVWTVVQSAVQPGMQPEAGVALGRCFIPLYQIYWWFPFYLRPWNALREAAPGFGASAPRWIPYALAGVMVYPVAAVVLAATEAGWSLPFGLWLAVAHAVLLAMYGRWMQRALAEFSPGLRNAQRRPAFPFGLLSRLAEWTTAQAGLDAGKDGGPAAAALSADAFALEGSDLQGGSYRLRFTLAQLRAPGGQIVVGRSPQDCTLVVGNPSVSRRHLRFTWDSSLRSLVVEDLESGNGTYVNGKLVTVPTALHRGDQLEMGDVRLVLAAIPATIP
jgi:serine/threonine protein kinase